MNLNELLGEKFEIFKKLYDIALIIDPVERKLISIENNFGEVISEDYNYIIKKEKICDDCVSMQAYLNNDTFIKIEYLGKKMFLINAIPIAYDNKIYIFETIKDITSNSTFVVDDEVKGNNIEKIISEMNEKIIKDYLTGVYNRRYINERIPIDIKESIIEGKPLSIIMADIDHFKNVNDTFGHLIGDEVLIDFARLISKSIRKDIDWVGRYGGEEFLIVLKDTDLETAYIKAEKIRKLIDETTFIYDNIDIHITSSFGVHGYENEKFNLEDLISKVDKKLYIAKASGRNKTVAHM